MYEFDEVEGVLRISKVDVPKGLVNRDLMKNQKDSYELYRTVTIKEDLNYLCDLISETLKVDRERPVDVSYEFIPKPKYKSRPNNEIKRRGLEYYPICVRFKLDGEVCTPEVEILRIPYMDDFCVLNVEGKQKVLLSEMKSVEDISFADKKDGLYLTAVIENRQLTFRQSGNEVKFKHNKGWQDIDKIVLSLMRAAGDTRSISEVFYNSSIRQSTIGTSYASEDTILEAPEKARIPEMLQSKAYALGKLRRMLNERLTIKDAQGRILARDVELKRDNETLMAGTIITEERLNALRFNCVNEVLVKERPSIGGMVLAEPVALEYVRKGTPMNEFLKKYMPDLKGFSYCPEDRQVSITVKPDVLLTEAMVDAFYTCGVNSVQIKSRKGSERIMSVPFFREICGNYTIQLKHLHLTNMPAHMNGDMYHYYFGKEKPWEFDEVISPTHLTAHDMIAIISLLTRAYADPTIPEVMSRDADFLKKINRANEIFSEGFRYAADNWTGKYKRAIKSYFIKPVDFEKINRMGKIWIQYIQNKKTLLAPIEDTNPVALLSQVNRVITLTQSANAVPEEMRTLALPFYGRICPYETPAGKNIGINNTLAIGCKVVDGIPLTPYHRLYGAPNNRRISTTVSYLSPTDEQDHRIGDRLSLSVGPDGIIKDTKVIARVKAYGSRDKTIIDTVDSVSLDYVNVLPEQHCSSTAMLVPFAAANDGVRVSFGLNLIRQAIYVQKSEIPLTLTAMYKELFNYSDSYCKRATEDGLVTEVSANALSVKYDNSRAEVTHQLMETRVSNQSVVSMTFRVAPGQRVKKGQVLIDSAISRGGYFSPGVNVICAIMPDAGYNYEDAVSLSDHVSHKFVSVSNNVFKKELRSDTTELTTLSADNTYQYVPEGGVIAEVNHTRLTDGRAPRREVIAVGKESGILYDCRLETDKKRKQFLTARLLGFKHLRAGDKMSGRHGNKGTDSRLQKTSLMPTFMNGIACDAVFNPCGIVSRMNMGQTLDGHCGFIAYLLGIKIESDPFNGASLEDVKELMRFVYDLANSESVDNVRAAWGTKIPEGVYRYAEINYDRIKEWEGCFFPDGSAPMWNPETGKLFENPITFGMPYFMKIDQEVDHKIHARGGMLEQDYSGILKQPRQGAAHGGGQKIGEMEMATLMSHGAAHVLWEMMNSKSDNVEERINLTMQAMSRDPLYKEGLRHYSPKSTDLWRYYMEALGVKVESDVLPPIDTESIKQRVVYDPRHVIRKQNKAYTVRTPKSYCDDILDELENI